MTELRTAQFCRHFDKLRKKRVKVRINTRLPYHHDTTVLQIQGWKAAKLLKNHWVKVCFYRDMRHRKLAIIDCDILWEGSLNILSQGFSREIFRRTVSTSMCEQMLNFTGMSRWR